MTQHTPSDLPAPGQPSPSTETPYDAISTLVAGGLPLESGLRALSEEVPSRRLRLALRRMSDELANGRSPEEVLSQSRRGLPHYLGGLVRAGVQSGQLGVFLEQFLLGVRRRRAASRGFWRMMAYPLLLIPLVLLLGTGVMAFIVPQFKDIFDDFGVELPAMTSLLMSFSSLPFVVGIVVGVMLFVTLAVLIVLLGPYVPGHATRLRWFQFIPLIGTPSRMRGLSEFCSLFGLLVRGGIPVGDALTMTSSALQDANLRQGSRRLAALVEQGESLAVAATVLPHFSAELKSLFRWEPRGDAFGDILQRGGEVYSARSQVQVTQCLLFLQPLIFLGVAAFVGFTVLALFLPLVKLLNALS